MSKGQRTRLLLDQRIRRLLYQRNDLVTFRMLHVQK